jgi:hypothetical protein
VVAERAQHVLPERLQVDAQRLESFRTDLIHATGALGLRLHEARLGEQLEVL